MPFQVYRRGADGAFVRVHCGDGPVRSVELGAYLVARREGGAVRLRIARDAAGQDIVPTADEAKRAADDRIRALEAELAGARRTVKVAHVTPSYYPAFAYGGPTESAHQLSRHLARAGCDVRVLTTDANGKTQVVAVDTTRELDVEPGLRVRYCARRVPESVSPRACSACCPATSPGATSST